MYDLTWWNVQPQLEFSCCTSTAIADCINGSCYGIQFSVECSTIFSSSALTVTTFSFLVHWFLLKDVDRFQRLFVQSVDLWRGRRGRVVCGSLSEPWKRCRKGREGIQFGCEWPLIFCNTRFDVVVCSVCNIQSPFVLHRLTIEILPKFVVFGIAHFSAEDYSFRRWRTLSLEKDGHVWRFSVSFRLQFFGVHFSSYLEFCDGSLSLWAFCHARSVSEVIDTERVITQEFINSVIIDEFH